MRIGETDGLSEVVRVEKVRAVLGLLEIEDLRDRRGNGGGGNGNLDTIHICIDWSGRRGFCSTNGAEEEFYFSGKVEGGACFLEYPA